MKLLTRLHDFRGVEAGSNCHFAPETCAILRRFPEQLKCSRCQIKFQMLMPNTYIWPHCGPTNARLRMQLGLMVCVCLCLCVCVCVCVCVFVSVCVCVCISFSWDSFYLNNNRSSPNITKVFLSITPKDVFLFFFKFK